MDNEATSAVDSAATSSTPATTPAHSEHTNTASGTRVPPLGADNERRSEQLERTSSISEEYMRYINNPENEEKRFPVDRKKLERLILVGGKDHESAESYFKNIEEQTGTLILWPSKLKIGAKSKKDPQVKVIGNPSAVQKARELILADLDAKATRVTLKIDIPFSEHSHVIGKEGCNIKKVHDETKCHIHFPDSNRSVHGEKSNQVSITGQVSAVETARKRIRDLLPIVVTFNLAMPGRVDPNSYEIQQIMLTYNVNIHIKPQPRSFSMSVVVRGTVKTIDGVKLAVSKVIEYFTGDAHSMPVVYLNLEIASQHHRTLIGHQGGNIKKIMQATDTVVQFPDPQSRYLSNQVTVNGTIDAIFNARDQLMGCLPVVLMFDVHESNENFLSSSIIGDLMQQLDVFISVKPKKGQMQSVIIKSIEQNLHCVYQARMKLLECSYQPTQAATPSDTIAIATSVDEPPMFQEKKVTGPLVPFSPISEESGEDVPSSAALQAGIASLKPTLQDTDTRRSTSKSPDSKSEDQRELQFESSMEIGSEPSVSPVETRPRSQSAGQRTATPPRRLTPRQFIDYDRKKEEAQKAMKSKIESSSPRFPTPKWAGYNFSESMPAGPRDQIRSPTSPSAVPQGLSSINRGGFQALARRASEERFLQRAEQDQTYHGVSDMPTLLQRLGLEHYQQRFDEEEVDFDTFLTMSESDLKEMGINTVGARRKLQIAISELKKIHSRGKLHHHQVQQHGGLGLSSTLGRLPYPSRGAPGGGLNRGGSLKHSSFNMSHSGRF